MTPLQDRLELLVQERGLLDQAIADIEADPGDDDLVRLGVMYAWGVAMLAREIDERIPARVLVDLRAVHLEITTVLLQRLVTEQDA